jgi:hypothetical protein
LYGRIGCPRITGSWKIPSGETRMKLMIIKSARECKPFSSAQSTGCAGRMTYLLHVYKNRL